MKLKKFIAAAAVAAAAVVALAPTGDAKASYTKDTWVFSYISSGAALVGEPQPKLTDSSAYMFCLLAVDTDNPATHKAGTYKATVYGATSLAGPFARNVYNGQASYQYVFSMGTVNANMINFVRESGRRYAQIYCEAGSGYKIRFSGMWSADVE